MLKLKLQYFGHLMRKADSFEKTLMLGKIEGRRRRGRQRMRWWMASPTQWTGVWVDSGSWWWTGRPGVLQSMGLQRVGHDWATELNWTELLWGYERLIALQSSLHWTSLCWGLEMWSISLSLRLSLWKTKKIILLSCQLNLEPMVLEINWAWIKINIGSTRICIYKEGHLGWVFMLPV